MMGADGWGDDTQEQSWAEWDSYDDTSLGMDDYDAREARDENNNPGGPGPELTDIEALEQELAEAIRNGDEDAADSAAEALLDYDDAPVFGKESEDASRHHLKCL